MYLFSTFGCQCLIILSWKRGKMKNIKNNKEANNIGIVKIIIRNNLQNLNDYIQEKYN